jgi:hypothetical protein
MIEIAQSGVSQFVSNRIPTDLNGSKVSFNIGGTTPSCISVSFSAQAQVDGKRGALILRAVLDDTDVSVDGFISLMSTPPTDFAEAHAYNFLFIDVPPGPHTVNIEFANSTDTGVAPPVTINDFDMLVRHR